MARSFNGTSDYCSTGALSGPSAACPITVACWAYPTAAVNATMYNSAVFGVDNNSLSEYRIGLTGNGTSLTATADARNPGADQTINTVATTPTNTWAHVCGTFANSGGNVLPTIFLNGGNSQVGGATFIGVQTLQGTSIGAMDLLATGQFNFFPGHIAEVGVWNALLSNAEILALGKGALPYTIRPSSLITYLPVYGQSSPEPDLSGHANNATVHGTALAAGPPAMMFTPRWPQNISGTAVASSVVFRRSLSPVGTRTGSRQAVQ